MRLDIMDETESRELYWFKAGVAIENGIHQMEVPISKTEYDSLKSQIMQRKPYLVFRKQEDGEHISFNQDMCFCVELVKKKLEGTRIIVPEDSDFGFVPEKSN